MTPDLPPDRSPDPAAPHEGTDPASAAAHDPAEQIADYAKRAPEAHPFAQLGVDGAGRGPESDEDAPEIAADDAGASAIAERAGRTEQP